jgi:hypothetical protein
MDVYTTAEYASHCVIYKYNVMKHISAVNTTALLLFIKSYDNTVRPSLSGHLQNRTHKNIAEKLKYLHDFD